MIKGWSDKPSLGDEFKPFEFIADSACSSDVLIGVASPPAPRGSSPDFHMYGYEEHDVPLGASSEHHFGFKPLKL